jgi:hypothetical protein
LILRNWFRFFFLDGDTFRFGTAMSANGDAGARASSSGSAPREGGAKIVPGRAATNAPEKDPVVESEDGRDVVVVVSARVHGATLAGGVAPRRGAAAHVAAIEWNARRNIATRRARRRSAPSPLRPCTRKETLAGGEK